VQRNKEAIKKDIHRAWSANEKTSMESALGMSYAGKRAMVCMKHVGLNVAADPFMNSAITGVNGGLIYTIADDPSMHSSQNEQDSRIFADFAKIPVLEPSNQQEAYDMAYTGFEFSEKYKIPVMLRITTRLAHSRSGVLRKEIKNENLQSIPDDSVQFVLLPSIARKRFKILLDAQKNFIKESEESIYNKYFDAHDKSKGIIVCGLAYNYLLENYPDGKIPFPVLKVSQYPIPKKLIKKITASCKEIIVLEDGYPFVESKIKNFLDNDKLVIRGRLDGTIPEDGELNPNIVASALGINKPALKSIPDLVTGRPPALCNGCGHTDLFIALKEALLEYSPGRVFSDIGCYTIAALPPHNMINSCVDMGASITMAKGASDAGLIPAVAVIGDSTFSHSGITGLLDVANEKTPVTVIISDNLTTGMTGGQDSSALNKIDDICKSVGVDTEHIKVIVPLKKNHEENVNILKKEIQYNGTSVIIARRECIQTLLKKNKNKKKVIKH
ncbi:thiamine pyrophosphate-dependent enzyme, partial [Bacteroidota bacterium]